MEKREKLGSRLGFIMLSAGCAIGCGNVWKFPWMCGQFGGGGFILVYLLCLLILGIPVLTMEFAIGRAAQLSPILMYQKLEKKGQKWHWHGAASFIGNTALMAFYTVVTGWIIYYFWRFATGNIADLAATGDNNPFVNMITNPGVNVTFHAVTVVVSFVILCFDLQKGLERITKYMMAALMILLIGLAVYSCFFLEGAKEGLAFYLIPDFSKINGSVIVGAMNQAFFTLSIGIGAMAIFGSYIGKERSLLGESVNIVVLDTFVAIVAGLIMFPACTTYGLAVDAGPSLLFNTMSTVFTKMAGGRWIGMLFFLFMVFAALSTVLAVCENLVSMIRDYSKMRISRPVACIICGVMILALGLTTALGYSTWSGFQPFAPGSAFLDFWDFIVSTNLLPLGSLVFALFCCNKIGWGWDNFVKEANTGKGLKIKNWMQPIFNGVPVIIIFIYIYGIVNFAWQ